MWEGCVTSFVVGKSKKTQPQGRAAPLWGAAEGRACVFFIFPSVFEVFCRLSHNYQHPPGQGVSIIMAFRVEFPHLPRHLSWLLGGYSKSHNNRHPLARGVLIIMA